MALTQKPEEVKIIQITVDSGEQPFKFSGRETFILGLGDNSMIYGWMADDCIWVLAQV